MSWFYTAWLGLRLTFEDRRIINRGWKPEGQRGGGGGGGGYNNAYSDILLLDVYVWSSTLFFIPVGHSLLTCNVSSIVLDLTWEINDFHLNLDYSFKIDK